MRNSLAYLSAILALGGILRLWGLDLDGNIELGLSALLGVLIIYLVYSLSASLFAAFIFAFNPWGIQLSRGPLWINLGLVVWLFVVILILKLFDSMKTRFVPGFAYIGVLIIPVLLVAFPVGAHDYYNYFSARFLFFGENYSSGKLLFGDLPLLLTGIAYFTRKLDLRNLIVLLWLIVAPLPAVLLHSEVGLGITASFVVPLVVLSGAGANFIRESLARVKIIFYFGIVLYLAGIVYFLDNFFVHMSR